MSTIDVIDAHGATQTVEKPLAPGRAAAASSRPVALSTEDNAVLAALLAVFPTALAVGTGISTGGTQRVVLATDQPALSNALRVIVDSTPSATQRLLSSAASTNATLVKNAAGRMYAIQGYSNAGTVIYLKLYNKATTPTVGTDTPIKTLALPPQAAFAFDFPAGYAFATGLGFGLTAGSADNDTTAVAAGDVLALNVDYA